MSDESLGDGRTDAFEEFENGYQAPQAVSGGKKRVRIVGTDLEFASFAECGAYLRISPRTVAEMVKAANWPGDVQIELI